MKVSILVQCTRHGSHSGKLLEEFSSDSNRFSQTTLTTIALGNETIGSMFQYIDQVEFDKQLQETFDEEHARVSAGEIIGNILVSIIFSVVFYADASCS